MAKRKALLIGLPWTGEQWTCPADGLPPGAPLESLVESAQRRCSEKRLGSMAHLGFRNVDPDVTLVIQAQRGDVAAFGELVERHKQPLVNYITRTLHDPIEAEDVAQNAFVRVFKALNRFRLSARFSTWLYAIARNLCLNELRRRTHHLTSSLDADDGERQDGFLDPREDRHPYSTAAEVLVGKELIDKTEEALAELPEPQRTAILLLREEELSYEQIAMSLKRSVPATKSVIHRGRQRLKSRLTPYLRNGHWHVASRSVKDSPDPSIPSTREKRNKRLLRNSSAKAGFCGQQWAASA
jgi:RNA polymerase sigma-70 factor (ECF subfamily)